MGGEDLVVYVLNDRGRIVNTYSGNKCASGTGEFLRQQLGRMNLKLEDINEICAGASVHRLSARCSVFMKSDCTHRLNKGEASKGDIALSLSKVMADKVAEFLTKAKIGSGRVVLIGGVTRNRHLVEFIRQSRPGIDFLLPGEAPYFEAFGAAHLITWTYAIIVCVIGAYLGWIYLATGNLLAPAVTHAVYDFAALWFLVAFYRPAE